MAQDAATGEAAGRAWPARLRQFLIDSWTEVRHKVTWPSREEVQGTTLVVLVTTATFAVILGVIDTAMAKAVQWLFAQVA